jgi:hypothetical protein
MPKPCLEVAEITGYTWRSNLFVADDGRSFDERDPGGSRPQDDRDGSPVRAPLACPQAVGSREDFDHDHRVEQHAPLRAPAQK